MCLALPASSNKGRYYSMLFLSIRKAIHDGKSASSEFFLHWDTTCNRRATKRLTEVIWRETGLNIFFFVCLDPYNADCVPRRKGLLVSLSVRKGKPLQHTLDLNHVYHRFLVFPALTPQLNLKMQASQKAVCARRHFSQPQNSPSYISVDLTSLFDSESLFLLFYHFSTASLSQAHRGKNPQLTPIHWIVIFFLKKKKTKPFQEASS